MDGTRLVRPLPFLVGAAATALTVWGWLQTNEARTHAVGVEFQREAQRVESAVREQVSLHETVLRAAQGLLDGSDTVSPTDWDYFTDSLRLEEKFPGIGALVFFEYAPNDETLADLLHWQSAVRGMPMKLRLPEGFAAGEDHYVATLVAPRRQLPYLLGIDLGGEPTRRSVAEAARDSGDLVMTSVLRLLSPKTGAVRTLEVAPVYNRGLGTGTVEERRAALRGVIAASYDVDMVLRQALRLSADDLRVEVYDQPALRPAGDGRASPGSTPIFQSGIVPDEVLFRHEADIRFGRRVWALKITAGSGLAGRLPGAGLALLLVGLAASVALGLLAWMLVTRRQQAQELADRMTAALQESEERYRQLFVGNRAVELLIDPEDGGRIVDANAAAARFYGWSVDTLRTMTISDINTLSMAEIKAEMAQAAAQRRDHFLFRHRLASGEERFVEVYSGPVPLGERSLLYSIIHDVTERHMAETALAVSEARFRTLFEDSPLAIEVLDPDGRATRSNPAWQVLWRQPPGWRPLEDPQLMTAGVADLLAGAFEGETIEVPAFRYQMATDGLAEGDHGVRWIRAYAYPIRDPGGRGHQLIVVWENVTEKLRQQEKLKETLHDLERSNAELEQFAYVASHDLQEPLRMISSYIGLLRRRYGEGMSPEALEFMSFAVDGAHRMQDIINDLLTYSRVGRKGRAFAPCDLDAIVRGARDTAAVSIKEAGAVVTIAPGLPCVMGDAHELGRLFQNIIGNAIKYRRADADCVVRVGCVAEGDAWRITVEDTGIGVAEEFFERIFQIFQRLHTREEFSGTGVGLAICKKIVERHGGRIGITSTPGEGSCIWFTLPAMAGDVEAAYVRDGLPAGAGADMSSA